MQYRLIYGESGIGKTMLLEKFVQEHTGSFDSDRGVANMPVVSMQKPPAPDERRFYSQMLAAVGAPTAPDERPHRPEGPTLRLYKQLAPQV